VCVCVCVWLLADPTKPDIADLVELVTWSIGFWLLTFGFLGDREERETQEVSTCQGFEMSRDSVH
jgi:hypothetical protein